MSDAPQDTQPQDAPVPPKPDNTGVPDDPQRRKAYDNDIRHAKSVGAKMAMEALLKDVGLENADDLKALIKAAKDKQDAEKSEFQKAQDALAAESKKAADAQTKLKEKVIEVAILKVAKDFIDPNDAVLLGDRSLLKIDADGNVEGAEDMIKKLAEAKPHLLKQDGPTRSHVPNPGATKPGAGKLGSGGLSVKEMMDSALGRALDTTVFVRGDGGVVGLPEE